MALEDKSFGGLIRELLGELRALMRAEMSLARAETQQKFEQAQSGAILLAIGMIAGFCSLLLVLVACAIALANFIPPAASFGAIGVVLGLFALGFVLKGRANLRARNLMPGRTLRSIGDVGRTTRERTT